MIRSFCTARHTYGAARKNRPTVGGRGKVKARAPGLAAHPPPQAKMTHDWIGPADATSNLRPVKFRIPVGETVTEERLRRLRAETQKWNQAFWANHNLKFNEEKSDFIKSWLEKDDLKSVHSDGSKRMPPAEDMSEFYSKFLTENKHSQLRYQREWYKRNFHIIYLSFRVKMARVLMPRISTRK